MTTEVTKLAKRIKDRLLRKLSPGPGVEKVQGISECVVTWKRGALQFAYSTPKTPGTERGYSLKVWQAGRMVFHCRWDSFEVVKFDRGEWEKLLP